MDLGIWEDIKDRLSYSRLGKSALIGLAALLILVAVFAGKNIVETATASEFKIGHEQSAQSAQATQGLQAAQGSQGSESASQTATIFVHVSGAVKNPGLVELGKGSRVADAINGAGGFADDASIDSVNLARVLEDGEQIFVSPLVKAGADGSAGDAGGQAGAGEHDGGAPGNAGGQEAGGAGAQSGNRAGSGQGSAQAGGGAGSKININTATEAELESLPGIGPSTAAKIIADRTANGSFASVDDLTRVSGIGEKKLSAISDLVCV